MKALKILVSISVLALLGLGSFMTVRQFPLWRDMRINSSSTGDIRLPSGHIVPSNRWFRFPSDAPELGFLQVQQGNTHHNLLFQSDISTELAATITKGGSKSLELIRGGSSGGRTEYWVEPVLLEP